MKKIFLLVIAGCLLFYFACWRLPHTKPVRLQPPAPTVSALLLPLDSRPVCTVLPQELGRLAGTNVILPPIAFLDNYKQPADREKLYLWLKDNAKNNAYAIISSDLLIHGGLINSRLPLGTAADQHRFLAELQYLAGTATQTHFSIFSVIPRLLVSDHLLPDRWYQWHLMNYAKLKDMTETFNDPYFTEQLLRREQEIPAEVLAKYNDLYKANDSFNKNLLTLTHSNIYTVIGQDDGSSFGLPNCNTNHAKMYSSHLENCHITYGADEIAASLIARNYLQQRQAVPKIFLQYAAPDTEFIYMPFMAASIGETLRDKVALTGAVLTDNKNEADIILYVSCGFDKFKPGQKQVKELSNLLQHKQVALIDLTANYTTDELLMPLLLENKVPVHRLAAYAGWNTFSNSAGTALAQAVIFTERKKELAPQQQPALHAQNAALLTRHLLDDYIYQKLYCPELKTALELRGFDPNNLSAEGQSFAQLLTSQYFNRKVQELLHYNLGQTPFYQQDGTEYYITAIHVDTYLPWNRVFEIGLDVQTDIGSKEQKKTAL